jgi:hypothetical protein
MFPHASEGRQGELKKRREKSVESVDQSVEMNGKQQECRSTR